MGQEWRTRRQVKILDNFASWREQGQATEIPGGGVPYGYFLNADAVSVCDNHSMSGGLPKPDFIVGKAKGNLTDIRRFPQAVREIDLLQKRFHNLTFRVKHENQWTGRTGSSIVDGVFTDSLAQVVRKPPDVPRSVEIKPSDRLGRIQLGHVRQSAVPAKSQQPGASLVALGNQHVCQGRPPTRS